MTASAFKTNISIENIRTDGITAYVYLHFLSPAPSEINKAYRFYTEYIDQGSTFFWTDQVRYWIDRYSTTNTDFSTEVSIRRNKVVVLAFDLSQGRLVDNRFVLNIKLHLKEEQLGISKDPTVWNSGVLTLSSREFSSPEIRCLYINNVEQKLRGKFKIKYKSSADKAIIENNATFYVEIYSPNRLLKREKVDLLTSSVSDLNYIEFSTVDTTQATLYSEGYVLDTAGTYVYNGSSYVLLSGITDRYARAEDVAGTHVLDDITGNYRLYNSETDGALTRYNFTLDNSTPGEYILLATDLYGDLTTLSLYSEGFVEDGAGTYIKDGDSYNLVSSVEEIYEERISKIEFTILLGDGQRLTSRTFVLDTLKNYTAYLAGPRGFTRILNFLVRVNDSTYLVKNIHKTS